MERIELPLSSLSLVQKLDLMEALWDDLSKEDRAFQSPSWHETILKDREQALATGKIGIADWEEAKTRIRRNVSCG